MNYGLTIYGPLDRSPIIIGSFRTRVLSVFPATTVEQRQTAVATLLNYPDFNHVDIVQKHSGDLMIHVYYSPVDVPEDADCVFHAKVSPGGTYA